MNVEEIRAAFSETTRRGRDLSLFRAELERIKSLAQRLKQAAGGPINDLIGVRYNTARIEGVLPLIFDLIAQHGWLLQHLDTLRDAAQEADAWLSGVPSFARLEQGQATELRMKVARSAAVVEQAAAGTLMNLRQEGII